MKLLMISQDFPPDVGGIQTYCQELAGRFVNWTRKFAVIAPQKSNANKFDNLTNYKIYRVYGQNAWLPLTAKPKVHNLIYNENYNVTFHAQWHTILSTYEARERGQLHAIYCAAHGREFLFNPFDPKSKLYESYNSFRRFLLSKADHFFAVSNYTSTLLQNCGVDKKRITVVPNATNPDQFYPCDVNELRDVMGLQGKKIVMSVCRLVKRKRVDNVIKAFAKIKDSHPDAVLVIVGDGQDRLRLENLADQLKMANRVLFLGWIEHEDPMMNLLYNLSDIFVMTPKTDPKQVEGFGVVYLEANACGKPVIGSRSGGIPDAVLDGETGFLVDEDNPDQLAEAFIKLLDNPHLAERLGQQGRQRVINDLNWDAVSERIYSKMNHLIGNTRLPSDTAM